MPVNRLKAPEIPEFVDWFNSDQPIKISDQFGKVVLLEFWTTSHVNCEQLLLDSNYLEKKYRDGLTVIGIHAPKYPYEQDSKHLEAAINRHKVNHPVVQDSSYQLMKKYGVRDWPTVILIDPEGFIIGALRGDSNREQIESLIQQQLMLAEQKNIRQYNKTVLTEQALHGNELSYPSRIYVKENKIFISDSGHNRIVEVNLNGTVCRSFGSFHPGLLDGHESDALFNNPQGMELIEDFLFVADTGNHAIRRIHLHTGEVHTIMGNGKRAKPLTQVYDDPEQAELNSPWALTSYKGEVYICMAGTHQIWKWQLSMNQLTPFMGTGNEDLADGLSPMAAFAQPTGICAGEFGLYVSDSESSAIRFIRMPDGQVTTLVGKGLFEFGDTDGLNHVARLQHPLDLQYDHNRRLIWICDTYNNKIKYLSLQNNELHSLSLTGLDEPGGIFLDNDILWIANTNAHQILKLELDKGQLSVFEIKE